MDVRIGSGYLSAEQKDEFVREWLGEGDPTGLLDRFEKPIKTEEKEHEPDQAREATDKE